MPRRNPERVWEILEELLDHKVEERAEILARECGDDLHLKKRVEAILTHEEEASKLVRSETATVSLTVLL